MPYNTSRAVVIRMQRYLDDMLNAGRTISWPSKEPKVLSRKIREGFAAAGRYDEYERYHGLKAWFRIKPMKGWVEAEYLGTEGESVVNTPEKLVVEEVLDVQGAAGACIKFEAKSDELHFPNAVLSNRGRLTIYKWGLGQVPKWHLISHEDAGITMTRKRGVDQAFLWSPEEEVNGGP